MSTESAAGNVTRIDALLPQTQCTRCGFSGCRPYAAAISAGEARINQCPPGGSLTIEALAQLLSTPVLPLNPANGVEAPPQVAWIDESRCIGCARCLPPCPVDAIVGAAKFMHAVLVERCTGCELCVAPCPVDCIEMRPRPLDSNPGTAADRAALNRSRYESHQARVERQAKVRQQELELKKAGARHRPPANSENRA